jgi:hypothetical protein
MEKESSQPVFIDAFGYQLDGCIQEMPINTGCGDKPFILLAQVMHGKWRVVDLPCTAGSHLLSV